jgi:hypothetical protein
LGYRIGSAGAGQACRPACIGAQGCLTEALR